MLENPEFHRNFRSELKLQHVAIAVALYGFLLFLLVFTTSEGFSRLAVGRIREVAEQCLLGLLFFHLGVSCVFATIRGAGSIARDREQGVLELERLTALTPQEAVTGRLLGLTAPLHLLNAVGLLLAVPLALLGGKPVCQTVVVYLLMTMATLAYCAFGLLLSATCRRSEVAIRSAVGGAGLVTAWLWAAEIPVLDAATLRPAFGRLFDWTRMHDNLWPQLANLAIPAEAITLAIFVLGIRVCLAGAAHCMEDPDRLPWSRGNMLAALAGGMGLGLAFFLCDEQLAANAAKQPVATLYALDAVMAFVLMASALWVIPVRQQVESELWRLPAPGWREQLLGERGDPLPFLLAAAGVSTAIPLIMCLPRWLVADQSLVLIGSTAVLGLFVKALGVAMAARSVQWMELLVSKGSRWLAGTILAALAVGPAWLAMMVQPQRPDWACYLFCANPPFALGVLADNTPRIVVNPVAFLAATAAVLGAFYMLFTLLWNRRQSRLAGEIGEKRRLMLKG
jgi:hypothetical protein